jgi:hypothetical protein
VAVDGNSVAHLQASRPIDGHDLARVLMARDGRLARTFQVLAIRAADGSRLDTNHHVAIPWFRCWYLVERNLLLTQKMDC